MVHYPVLELDAPAIVGALDAVNSAIKGGYGQTTDEMRVREYDRRIEKTAFGQILHHNINQQVFDIGRGASEFVTDLPPNHRRSHHHVIVTVQNVLITISAVGGPNKVPRPAFHRSRYAMQQTYFRTDGFDLRIVPVPDPFDSNSLYLQLLHGPTSTDHTLHGFTVVRMLDIHDQYLPDIINLDEHLASIATTSGEYENVTEDFKVTILPEVREQTGGADSHEGDKQYALW